MKKKKIISPPNPLSLKERGRKKNFALHTGVRVIFPLFLLLFTQNLSAFSLTGGARSLGVGGISSVVTPDPAVIFSNPALSSLDAQSGLLLSFMPVYGMEGSYYGRGAFSYPLKSFKVTAGYFGQFISSFYSSMQALGSVSIPLFKGVYAGGNIKFLQSKVAVTSGESSEIRSSASAFTFDLGFFAVINKNFEMGISARNLTDPELKFGSGSGIKEARILDAGIRFNFLKDFHLLAETELEQDRDAGFRFGADMVFFKTVSVRAGVDRDGLFSLGAGLNLAVVSIDLAMVAHPDLGNIVQADISSKF